MTRPSPRPLLAPLTRPARRALSSPLATCALLASAQAFSCARREPPQWDAGGASFAVVTLPGAPSTSPSAAATPPTPPTTTDASARDAAAAIDAAPDDAALPQTRDEPDANDPRFLAGAAALWDAIASDDPERAMSFFFPLAAYEQVKDVQHPERDWRFRLVAAYKRDIHDLHRKLGARVSRSTFARAEVPMARARWVEPGEEYNKIGYFRVFGTKLRGEVDGRTLTVDVTSLISWRGRWYCVHLSGIK